MAGRALLRVFMVAAICVVAASALPITVNAVFGTEYLTTNLSSDAEYHFNYASDLNDGINIANSMILANITRISCPSTNVYMDVQSDGACYLPTSYSSSMSSGPCPSEGSCSGSAESNYILTRDGTPGGSIPGCTGEPWKIKIRSYTFSGCVMKIVTTAIKSTALLTAPAGATGTAPGRTVRGPGWTSATLDGGDQLVGGDVKLTMTQTSGNAGDLTFHVWVPAFQYYQGTTMYTWPCKSGNCTGPPGFTSYSMPSSATGEMPMPTEVLAWDAVLGTSQSMTVEYSKAISSGYVQQTYTDSSGQTGTSTMAKPGEYRSIIIYVKNTASSPRTFNVKTTAACGVGSAAEVDYTGGGTISFTGLGEEPLVECSNHGKCVNGRCECDGDGSGDLCTMLKFAAAVNIDGISGGSCSSTDLLATFLNAKPPDYSSPSSSNDPSIQLMNNWQTKACRMSPEAQVPFYFLATATNSKANLTLFMSQSSTPDFWAYYDLEMPADWQTVLSSGMYTYPGTSSSSSNRLATAYIRKDGRPSRTAHDWILSFNMTSTNELVSETFLAPEDQTGNYYVNIAATRKDTDQGGSTSSLAYYMIGLTIEDPTGDPLAYVAIALLGVIFLGFVFLVFKLRHELWKIVVMFFAPLRHCLRKCCSCCCKKKQKDEEKGEEEEEEEEGIELEEPPKKEVDFQEEDNIEEQARSAQEKAEKAAAFGPVIMSIFLRLTGILMNILKLMFNVSIIWKSFSVFSIKKFPSWPQLQLGINVNLPGFSEIASAARAFLDAVDFMPSVIEQTNCGSTAQMGATLVVLVCTFATYFILQKDLLLLVGINLQKLAKGKSTMVRKLVDKGAQVAVTIMLYVLQALLTASASLGFKVMAGGLPTCSLFDYTVSSIVRIASIVVLVVLALAILRLFSGRMGKKALRCTIIFPPAFVFFVLRNMLCLTVGYWSQRMADAYDIVDRAEKFDDDPDDDDNQHQNVLQIFGKSRGVFWMVFPGMGFMAKIAESLNDPPALTFRAKTLDLYESSISRWLKYIKNTASVALLIVTVFTAKGIYLILVVILIALEALLMLGQDFQKMRNAIHKAKEKIENIKKKKEEKRKKEEEGEGEGEGEEKEEEGKGDEEPGPAPEEAEDAEDAEEAEDAEDAEEIKPEAEKEEEAEEVVEDGAKEVPSDLDQLGFVQPLQPLAPRAAIAELPPAVDPEEVVVVDAAAQEPAVEPKEEPKDEPKDEEEEDAVF